MCFLDEGVSYGVTDHCEAQVEGERAAVLRDPRAGFN
jgi:hypothetical protein